MSTAAFDLNLVLMGWLAAVGRIDGGFFVRAWRRGLGGVVLEEMITLRFDRDG